MSDRNEELLKRIEALEATLNTKPLPIDPDVLYTAAEVAQRLRCTSVNIYNLINTGRMSCIKTGGTSTGVRNKGLRIRGRALLDFLDSNESAAHRPSKAPTKIPRAMRPR